MNGHQPHLTPLGLYYTANSGTINNRVEWRVSYNGRRINGGETIIESSTIECGPNVYKLDDIYYMSFITMIRGEHQFGIVLISSNNKEFDTITSRRVFMNVPNASFIDNGLLYTLTLAQIDGGEGVLCIYDTDNLNLIKSINIAPRDLRNISASPIRISRNYGTSDMTITYISKDNEDDVYTVIYRESTNEISNILKCDSKNVYKSSILDNKIAHAVKVGDFEDRKIYKNNLDDINVEFSSNNPTSNYDVNSNIYELII